MVKKIVGVVCAVFLIFSCSDEDDVKKENRFGLSPGNYWIYRTRVIHPDESSQIFDHLDSVWIEGTTTINGREYYVQESTLNGTQYLRDSANCILLRESSLEQIIYSENFRDTLFREPPIVRIMTDVNKTIEVPAGKLRTSNCRTLLRREKNDGGHHSHFPVFSDDFYTAQQYICSEQIGIVKQVSYYIGNTIEYELVRYKLK
jgi:hypothetical protein